MVITITATPDQLTPTATEIPRDFLAHLVQTMGKNSVGLYLHLLDLLNSDDELQFRSLASATKPMGIDRTTLWRAFRELRETGLVEIDSDNLKTATELRVNTFGAGS